MYDTTGGFNFVDVVRLHLRPGHAARAKSTVLRFVLFDVLRGTTYRSTNNPLAARQFEMRDGFISTRIRGDNYQKLGPLTHNSLSSDLKTCAVLCTINHTHTILQMSLPLIRVTVPRFPPLRKTLRDLRRIRHSLRVPHGSTQVTAQRKLQFVCEFKNYEPQPNIL